MRSTNIEEDMAEDRNLVVWEWIDDCLLYIS